MSTTATAVSTQLRRNEGSVSRTLRSVTDEEKERLERFCAEHPEYEKLGYGALLQVAATYRDEDTERTFGELRAAGVPAGFRRAENDDVNPAWSDEQ